MTPLHVIGMHGLGDNLHQRGILRQLMESHEVWLETPWPALYHDMPELHLVDKGSSLRTQAKNAVREACRFTELPVPAAAKRLKVSYSPVAVRQHGSVLAAMSAHCGVSVARFALPIPDAWADRADRLIEDLRIDRPIMIYRPLVERTEWSGCPNRNPDHAAYADLFDSIRERFFVVSVADLEPGREWKVGGESNADAEFHGGELDIEVLAALMARSSVAYSAPGFAVILAQAVQTPAVAVFGGYECSTSFSAGAQWSPYLGIDPDQPCMCFSHSHRCKKAIDLAYSKRRLMEFLNAHCAQPRIDQPAAA